MKSTAQGGHANQRGPVRRARPRRECRRRRGQAPLPGLGARPSAGWEPERFQVLRRAYEAVSGQRERLERKLLHTSTAPLFRLKLHCLAVPGGERRRASPAALTALLLDGLQQADR